MIEYTRGDILLAEAEALVNPANCVGVMGRGLALQFKNAHPANFDAYKAACDRQIVRPGQMFVFCTAGAANPKYIINFPTKRHWREKSRLQDIRSGLEDLVHITGRDQIRSIAVPALGSGLGGLDWNCVRPEIDAALGALSQVRAPLLPVIQHTSQLSSRRLPPVLLRLSSQCACDLGRGPVTRDSCHAPSSPADAVWTGT